MYYHHQLVILGLQTFQSLFLEKILAMLSLSLTLMVMNISMIDFQEQWQVPHLDQNKKQ